MKIKKKRYKKELRDAYWRGVDDGIKYALNDPERAKRISGAQLRAQIEDQSDQNCGKDKIKKCVISSFFIHSLISLYYL